jgi:hypothetical protein
MRAYACLLWEMSEKVQAIASLDMHPGALGRPALQLAFIGMPHVRRPALYRPHEWLGQLSQLCVARADLR